MTTNTVLLAAAQAHADAAQTLMNGVRGIGAASVVLQTYAATVRAQADLPLEILPDLPQRQEKARDHAEVWLKCTNPMAMTALGEVRDFANHINVYLDVLLPLAQQCDCGDSSQMPTILQGLQTLLRLAREKAESATDLMIEVQIYQTYIASDAAAFSWAETKVRSHYDQSRGEIRAMRTHLATQNRRINTGIILIAAGAVSDIVGIYMVLFAHSTVVATAGAARILLAAGIGLIASGTLAMTASAADILDVQKNYTDTIEPLRGVKAEVAAFDTVAHHVTANVPQAQAAYDAATQIAEGWNGVAGALTRIITALEQQPDELTAQLLTIKRDWIHLGQQAKAILLQGNLPFKTLGNNDPTLTP